MEQQTLFEIEPLAPQKKETTIRFYEDVKKEYLRLYGIRKNGVRVYSVEYILMEVARKFYRSERTIENIVFNRV